METKLTAEEYLESQKIIENTDLVFRCKLPSKDYFINFDVVRKSLSELMQEYSDLQCEPLKQRIEELEKENEKLNLEAVRLEGVISDYEGKVSENYKQGDWITMVENYAALKKGMCFQLLRLQSPGSNKINKCWVVDHDGKKSYLAPFESHFRLALKSELTKRTT